MGDKVVEGPARKGSAVAVEWLGGKGEEKGEEKRTKKGVSEANIRVPLL